MDLRILTESPASNPHLPTSTQPRPDELRIAEGGRVDHERMDVQRSRERHGVSVSDFMSCIGCSLTRHRPSTRAPRSHGRTSWKTILIPSARNPRPACPENRIYVSLPSPRRHATDATIPELACGNADPHRRLLVTADGGVPRRGGHPYESGRAGHCDARGSWLGGMHCIEGGGTLRWLGSPGSRMGDAGLAEAVGFTGSDSPVTAPHGSSSRRRRCGPPPARRKSYVVVVRTCAVGDAEGVVSFVPGGRVRRTPWHPLCFSTRARSRRRRRLGRWLVAACPWDVSRRRSCACSCYLTFCCVQFWWLALLQDHASGICTGNKSCSVFVFVCLCGSPPTSRSQKSSCLLCR